MEEKELREEIRDFKEELRKNNKEWEKFHGRTFIVESVFFLIIIVILIIFIFRM